jgi:hypothetical protein
MRGLTQRKALGAQQASTIAALRGAGLRIRERRRHPSRTRALLGYLRRS